MRWICLLVATLLSASASAQPPEEEIPRLEGQLLFPTLRVGIGYGRHLDSGDPNGFELDVTTGLRMLFRTRGDLMVGFLPEAGYARHGGEPGGDHAIAGTTLLFGADVGDVNAGPGVYAVVGRAGGERAAGIRSVLLCEALLGAVGIELSHEWRRIGDVADHMVRVMVAFRLESMVMIGMLAAADWSFD